MIRSLRRRHLATWVLCTAAVAALLFWALLGSPP